MRESVLIRNNVVAAGDGTAMIFGHGFGGDQRMWRFIHPAFDNFYRTILFDYVGSGGSDFAAYDSERYSSLEGYATDLLEICEALDIRDAVYVGHSFGSMVGIAAAIREPTYFSQLILLAPNACFINDPPDYIGGLELEDVVDLLSLMERNMTEWANFLAPVAMGNADRPELSEELAATFCANDPTILRRFAKVAFLSDNRSLLPSCPTPSLVLQCRDDSIAPPSVGEFICREIPRCQLRQMQATGHCPHLSHPVETIRLIKEYLATVRG